MMVLFTMIHFYDPCQAGWCIPDSWHISHDSSVLSLYLGRFQLFYTVHVSSVSTLVQFF